MRPDVPHYNNSEIQPIDLIRSRNLNYAEGNVIKYICRYRTKGGAADLQKARDYLEWLIEDWEKAEGLTVKDGLGIPPRDEASVPLPTVPSNLPTAEPPASEPPHTVTPGSLQRLRPPQVGFVLPLQLARPPVQRNLPPGEWEP